MKSKLIKLDFKLFDRVVKSAEKNDRSVNAEIRHLLKVALDK